MAALLEANVRAAGKRRVSSLKKTAEQMIRETHFDVFLSHSIDDAELVLGVVEYLNNSGMTAYVDWIVDPSLDRASVNAVTATRLRDRMEQCDMLFYLWSNHARQSRWMPWELGYFDGRRGKVAILPMVTSQSETYSEVEFVSLYPTVDFAQIGSKPIFQVSGLNSKSWAHTPTAAHVLRG